MRRYTIAEFIKGIVAVLSAFVAIEILDVIYILACGGEKMHVAAGVILGAAGAGVIAEYLFRIKPSVDSLKKTYNEFASGKTITLQIEPSTHMFLAEEEELLNRLNELIDRRELLEASNKQAEYLALQNQIHPHFLYNTLEAMRGDALVSGMESLANVAAALSAFFRYTISDMKFLVNMR